MGCRYFSGAVFACIMVIVLSGCGGGGGGGEDSTNHAPVASAVSDESATVGDMVTLDGSGSSDPDGDSITYAWTQSDSTGISVTLSDATAASPTFTAPTVDTSGTVITFQLTVTDQNNSADTADVAVTINRKPTAVASADVSIATEGDTVTLDGTGSSDPDGGSAITYAWTQTDSTGYTAKIANAAASKTKATIPDVDENDVTLTFRLTITDESGGQATSDVSINVNRKPVADAGSDQSVVEGAMVTLYGSGSSDPEGSSLSYAWAQTSGTTVNLTGATTDTLTFTAPSVTASTYLTFQLTVTDNDGGQGTDTVKVYVTHELFSEDSFTDLSSWTFYDETSKAENSSSWDEDDNQLRYKSYVGDDYYQTTSNTATTYKIGSYALLKSSALSDTLTSYRFSVDITPLANNSSDFSEGNDLGIIFGYVDTDNYYRVAMNARFGYTRFEKRTDTGEFKTLAVNAIGYKDDESTTINMTVEVNDGTIVVWIGDEDEPVFATVDDTFPSTSQVALYCQDQAKFDNVMITENSQLPTVAIATPLAYSVTPNNYIAVKTVVLNAPDDGYVMASIDGSSQVSVNTPSSDGYYKTTFSDLDAMDHSIIALLVDAEGNEVGSDTNSKVGTGGEYIITIGDSITNGVGDTVAYSLSDNERIAAHQGYQIPLSNLLAENDSYPPQIIFNEGIPGDLAEDLVERIDSIVERHGEATKFLLMIGTNDSDSGVSASSYGVLVNEMATIIDDTNEKELLIADPLPTYDDSGNSDGTRDDLIEEYIAQIDSIIRNHDNTNSGPNFFNNSYFNNSWNTYYYDGLHPNDTGYDLMAEEWSNILN